MKKEYRIDTAETNEDIEKLRTAWTLMNRNPEADIDFFMMIVNSRENVLGPYVVALREGDRPIALMIARLESTTIDVKIGYVTLKKVPVKSINILYNGIQGEIDDSSASMLVGHIKAALRSRVAEAAFFHGLQPGSTLFRAVMESTGPMLRDAIIRPTEHWAMNLPESKGGLPEELRSKHHNYFYQAGRLERKIKKDLGEECRTRIFRAPEDVDRLCIDAESIAKRTYQRALGAGFQDTPENRNRLSLEAATDRLCALIFYIGDNPVSFWIGSVFEGTFHSAFTAYDPDFREYGPGNIVFTHLLEAICERGARRLDFGGGDAFYKERFGDINWMETPVNLYAPSPRMIALNIFRTATLSLDSLARAILGNLKVAQRIKTAWRRKISKTKATGAV